MENNLLQEVIEEVTVDLVFEMHRYACREEHAEACIRSSSFLISFFFFFLQKARFGQTVRGVSLAGHRSGRKPSLTTVSIGSHALFSPPDAQSWSGYFRHSRVADSHFRAGAV